MKKIVLMCFFVVMCMGTSRAQSCDCTITPYKPSPPCFDSCTKRLLGTTNLNELIYIIGLKEDAARKIMSWPKRTSVRSLDEYQEILSPNEFRDVKRRANSLNQQQLMYIYNDGGPTSQIGERVNRNPASVANEAAIDQLRQSQILENKSAVAEAQTSASPASCDMTKDYDRQIADVTYFYYKDTKGAWRWRLKAANGRTMANSSEGYKTERECLEAIARVKASGTAPVRKN